MPHLSPLNWILSPVIFYLLLSLFMMNLWWSQTLTFPTMHSFFIPPTSHLWPW